jgi:hypothetical protein
MFSKVGLLEETKKGGKEEKNDSEIDHICVGTDTNTIKTVK